MSSNIPESPASVTFLDLAAEKVDVTPISPPPSNTSRESLETPTKPQESRETSLQQIRRFTATPSPHASGGRSVSVDPLREKSPMSLSSLSDFDGSEASHTERRFLRLYEELDSHCSGINSIDFWLM